VIVWRTKRENYQVCSVQYCVQQLCTIHTHMNRPNSCLLVSYSFFVVIFCYILSVRFSFLWPPCVADTDIIFVSCLWPPYVIGQAIIFLPCSFFLSSFFFSPNLIGHRLDVYHTLTPGVALVRI